MGSRMDARLSIAVVAAVFFAASAFPGISAGLEVYSPGHLALLRLLMASFVLAIYAVFSGMRLPAARVGSNGTCIVCSRSPGENGSNKSVPAQMA